MSESWYELVAPAAPLTQGDILRGTSVLVWKDTSDSASLRDWAEGWTTDTVVLTQACDLERRKVTNVVLGRLIPLTTYRSELWQPRLRQRNQNPSEKAWRRTLEDIAAGYVWNQMLLDRFDHADYGFEVQVVEFQDIFTVPRVYLDARIAEGTAPRPRLRPPYREHLSQAFARFFMRVGLPQSVTLPA
ncbi:MAG TPA: hypothetical protein VH092_03395 [Urbifossiella sp.]|jgi:hypothetical protein|nr:hypothetical protein [Urbifossiella sp.]